MLIIASNSILVLTVTPYGLFGELFQFHRFAVCVRSINGWLVCQSLAMQNHEELESVAIDRHARSSTTNGNVWSKLLFQRIFLFSLARLIIYLNKMYQDVGAVRTYYDQEAIYFSMVSLFSLVSPAFIYAVYLTFEALNNSSSTVKYKTIITKFINGLLLMPWQIKRHLDGLYFSSQRLCSFRPGKPDELKSVSILGRNAELLEFFEDFYAGFLQVILQLYILSFQMKDSSGQDSLLIGELVGSSLSIFSMLIAIRRRDDGIFTGFLSFVGWLAMFTSRVVVFSLAFTILRYWLTILCSIHVFFVTIWVYRIAWESHQAPLNPEQNVNPREKPIGKSPFQLGILTFLFFGIPSLLMWPIMFQLKERKRPLIFLIICTLENVILLLLWYGLKQTNTTADMYSMLTVVIGTFVADFFLSGYMLCKPSLVDEVVLHEMRYTATDSFGIYYEFCDIVFRLNVTKQLKEELVVVERIINGID